MDLQASHAAAAMAHRTARAMIDPLHATLTLRAEGMQLCWPPFRSWARAWAWLWGPTWRSRPTTRNLAWPTHASAKSRLRLQLAPYRLVGLRRSSEIAFIALRPNRRAGCGLVNRVVPRRAGSICAVGAHRRFCGGRYSVARAPRGPVRRPLPLLRRNGSSQIEHLCLTCMS